MCGRIKELRVVKDDRVVGFVTNIPETVIAMLAAASLERFGLRAPLISDTGCIRSVNQIQPKVLFAVESYQYNGKIIDCTEKIEQITAKISSIERVIKIPHFDDLSNENTDG